MSMLGGISEAVPGENGTAKRGNAAIASHFVAG
jgi:hypothetical protein